MNNIDLQIKAYLNGELTGEPLVTFEQLLKDDPSVVEQLALHQSLRFIFKYENLFEAQEKLNQLYKTDPLQPNFEHLPKESFRFFNSRWFWWVGGVLMLSLVSYLSWQSWQTNRHISEAQQLTNTFLANTPPYENVIEYDSTVNRPLEEGLNFYDVKEYGEAVKKLQQHVEFYQKDSHARFYLGLCYLYLKKSDLAINQLKLIADNDTDFSLLAVAQWHLALAYLQKGDMTSAQPLLQNLAQHDDFKIEATNILKELSK